MLIRTIVVALALAGLTAACAGTDERQPVGPAAQAAPVALAPAPEATPAATAALGDAAPKKTIVRVETADEARLAAALGATDDNPVVCKEVTATGSRVRRERICRLQSTWERDTSKAKDYANSIQRSGAPQPGGELLPTGG